MARSNLLPAFLGACLLSISSAQSQANLITYDFTGSAYGYGETDQYDLYKPVPLGTAVTGSFSFDTASAPNDTDGVSANWWALSSYRIQVNGFSYFSYIWNADPTRGNLLQSTGGLLQLSTVTVSNQVPFNESEIYLADTSPSPLLTLNEIDSFISSGTPTFLGLDQVVAGQTSFASVRFYVTSLTRTDSSVPEPATAALLGFSSLGAVALSRPRRRAAVPRES
jgi:hypothetical protein